MKRRELLTVLFAPEEPGADEADRALVSDPAPF